MIIEDVKCTHANKLFNLGVPFNVYGYVAKVVNNFPNYSLSKKEKEILAYGLEHNVSAKLCKIKYFTHFEILTNRLCEEPIFNITKNDYISRLKVIGYDVFRKCKKEKKRNLLTEEDISVLKTLGKNENLHITHPDKWRGVVILNIVDYTDKMENILSNPDVFENCPFEEQKQKILRTEDKINRFLKKLKD